MCIVLNKLLTEQFILPVAVRAASYLSIIFSDVYFSSIDFLLFSS